MSTYKHSFLDNEVDVSPVIPESRTVFPLTFKVDGKSEEALKLTNLRRSLRMTITHELAPGKAYVSVQPSRPSTGTGKTTRIMRRLDLRMVAPRLGK